jgi:superfamily II DNA or RNA helicase
VGITQGGQMITSGCGYLPHPDELDAINDLIKYKRVLVVNGPAHNNLGVAPQSRWLFDPEIQLPEGLFWFDLGFEPLLVLVWEAPSRSTSGSLSASPEEIESNPSHPLRSAWGWAEHYWDLAHSIPSPNYEVGVVVQHASKGADMVVRDRTFRAGKWTYKVLLEGRETSLLEDAIVPLTSVGGPLEWIVGTPSSARQFGATLSRAKLEGRFANTIFSFRASRTIFRAYQFKPVLKMLQTGKSRILIADEVGLGKTIEAGLVWTELEARQEADRVFVLCPASLVSKWKQEMEERFGFELRDFDRSVMANFADKLLRNQLPPRFAYIATIERMRRWEELQFLAERQMPLDLLIIDEAHSMRNQATKNYATGSVLADLASSAVFLTATPINLKETDVLNLTGMLAPEDALDPETWKAQLEPNRYLNKIASILGKPDPSRDEALSLLEHVKRSPYGAITAERSEFSQLEATLRKPEITASDIVSARRNVADLNALATVISRTRKAEVDEKKPTREPQVVEVIWSAEELNFYSEFLNWCKSKARRSGSHLMFSMQMPLRLASACLPMARNFVLEAASRTQSLIDEDQSTDTKSTPTYDDVTPELVAAAMNLPDELDTKLVHLRSVLSGLKTEGRRAILFTHSRPTLAYLASKLSTQYRVAQLHGGVAPRRRNEILAEFRAGNFDFVLANRVASEGLDFEFCSVVINYDLPWNPMEVEQRIGRIDRIGQPEEKIFIVNFYNPQTVDETIVLRLLERISIFKDTIGELEPIIEIEGEMKRFWESLDFDLDIEQQNQKLLQVELAFEEQRHLLGDVSDQASALFLANDVDIDGLEDSLVKSGRYLGQRELANLIVDWTQTDGGIATIGSDSLTVVGNNAMAHRVTTLATKRVRTHGETEFLATSLRNEIPISLSLDQEIARTSGETLLNANHPLVVAALTVPLHRRARLARVQIPAGGSEVSSGSYVVVIAVARNASRGGDEVWGEACALDNSTPVPAAYDLVMSQLATGDIAESAVALDSRLAQRCVQRLVDRIETRHALEQRRRTEESDLFQRSREKAILDQYDKKRRTIMSRISALESKGASESVMRMTQGQLTKLEKDKERNLAAARFPENVTIEIEYLAVCTLEVI